MLIETLAAPARRARRVNSTNAVFFTPTVQVADPAGDAGTAGGRAVLDFGLPAGGVVQNWIHLMFFGTGAGGNTFNCRLFGWRQLAVNGVVNWQAVFLAQFGGTLSSAAAGIAGGNVLDTELYADTLTLAAGNTVSTQIVSPTGGIPAHCLADMKGCSRLELVFAVGTTTSMNALAAVL